MSGKELRNGGCGKQEKDVRWKAFFPSSSPAYVRIEGDDRKHVLSGS